MFQYRQVLVRLRAGDTAREIARSGLLGRDKLTELARLAQAQGWLDAEHELPDDAAIAAALAPRKRAASTLSSVEPLREVVQRWFDAGVQGSAICAALKREHGFTGSYSAVRRMLQGMRASLPPEVTVRLSFAPAEAAQVDFGAGPKLTHPDGTERRTWAFVMTLCHSRHQYVEFVWDQTVATWLGCHRRAFEWFDAVPERLIIDNAKCAIIKACRHDPLVQRAYAECAEGYSFKIDACPPHDPQKKGIVEAGVKYVKGNFLPTRTFRDLADLNAQVQQWVMQEAGRRVHGTTLEQPLVLFALEKPLMRRLPSVAPDLGAWHRVTLHRDCHVQFDRSYYSAPYVLASKALWLRATDTVVALYEDYRHVCTHLRARRPGQRMTQRDHLPPQAQDFFARDKHWCLTRAADVGPHCTELIARLLGDRISERLRAAQGVLGLASRYGTPRLETACERALCHDSPHLRTVKTILSTGADLQAITTPDTPAAYANARFTRSAADLFDADGTLH
ncbi:IS21 family transposase [Paucibacter sp. XJ19-41]|uniref:IS21 family transposase n=1 Tax=Paucibacter sp. XJ19-41 TaxID=2927824 RepID=UPI00234B3BB3|nr:IS21 family transposase [Paucibacter sp. XJ19-41]MDC6171355.1 IS21 family transposase [Paucibacter sp. XJ19-41]